MANTDADPRTGLTQRQSRCPHNIVSSTFERGPHCCECNVDLLSMFHTIPRPLWDAAHQAAQSGERGERE